MEQENSTKALDDGKIQLIFSEVFNLKNDASVTALQVIKALCGYDQSNIRLNGNGDIASGVNLYNEGRRSVYIDMRKHLSDAMLTEVEIKRRLKHGAKKQGAEE